MGSIVSDFNNAAGAAALKGNQLFGPYGVNRYFAGNINTAKGFIGQYNDGTGLDYLNARYYDPVVGVFLSADMVQGNLAGMNPYAYVNGNPETHSDPSGRMFIHPGGGGGGLSVSPPPSPPPPSSCSGPFCWAQTLWHGAQQLGSTAVHVVAKVADFVTGASSMVNDVRTVFSSKASFWDKVGAVGDFALNAGMDVAMLTGIGEAARGVDLLVKGGVDLGEHLLEGEGADTLEHAAADLGCGLSFAPATLVATAKGEQAIGTLQVGEKVWAYNPKTHKMEQEPILHVWINHDTDLVDLTLTTTTAAGHGKAATKMSETIHTNKEHPFLTKEKGFLPVGQIKLDMHVLRADGTYGVVTGWKVVSGTQVMYNLEVAQDHTFTVGAGEWVVHNDCNRQELRNNLNLGRGDPYQGNHIIPCELGVGGRNTMDLLRIAETGGTFRMNAASNGIGLPTDAASSEEIGVPYHMGSHDNYTAQVYRLILKVTQGLARRFGGVNAIPPDVAGQALSQVDTYLEGQIWSAGGGVCLDDIVI